MLAVLRTAPSPAHSAAGISLADIDTTDARKSVKMAFAVGCATGRAVALPSRTLQVLCVCVQSLSRCRQWDTQLNEYPCFNNVSSAGLPIASLVSIRLDMDQKTLTFGLNGWQRDLFASSS